jgi:hypothetical protein
MARLGANKGVMLSQGFDCINKPDNTHTLVMEDKHVQSQVVCGP